MVVLLLLMRQRSKAQQRIKIVKDLGDFARKSSARGRRGREFAADDPRQYPFPICRGSGPTGMLRPFAFLDGVPVALVTPAEALLLFRNPAGIRVYARLCNQCECGFFALPT